MTILNALLASSVVAVGLLAQTAAPVNALAAPAHAVRNAVTPNHNGMIKRKRNAHKLRKRCVAGGNSSSASASPSPSPDNSGNNNNNNNNNNGGDNSGNNNNNNSGGSTTSSNNNSGATYTPSSAPACSGGKVGLGWDWQLSTSYMAECTTWKTCYYYNWSAFPDDPSVTGSLKFAPMLWGQDKINDFQGQVINSGTNFGVALGMNEVNQSGQSNMDPGTGAWLWNTYIAPLRAQGYYLVSPSTTSDPNTGPQWMQSWYNQLSAANQPDAIATHWYGTSFADLQNWIGTISGMFPGKKIWLTEFACTDFSYQTTCDVQSFVNQAIPWLDSNPVIEMYAPFGFVPDMSGVQEDNRCINTDGSLTNIGRQYLGL